MPKTTIDYDPFLRDECNKYGYCIKSNTLNDKMLNKIKEANVKRVLTKIEEKENLYLLF